MKVRADGRRVRRMRERDPDEPHRAATPLELLFDLCFVVAVAQVADRLHHALGEGRFAHGLLAYGIVFFGIWWAWMNFTWFASAFDTDDVPYRVLTLVQIAGVLVVAAGVPAAFDDIDLTVTVAGYVLMRLAMVTQWLRVARDVPAMRTTALRYAAGVGLLQVGWVARLLIPAGPGLAVLFALGVGELLVPVWAERGSRGTPWHPGHIAERYGLFTMIVLGEAVLAATLAVEAALAASATKGPTLVVAGGGLALIFALWWIYFDRPAEEGLRRRHPMAFAWGYGHIFVFGSIAAAGAGLQVAVEVVGHHAAVGERVGALAVAVPVVVYLVTIGLLHGQMSGEPAPRVAARFGAAAVLVTAAAIATPPLPLPATVVLVAALTAGLVVVDVRARQDARR